MQDFYGNTKAGFEITGTIKRKGFGLTWDGMTEAGGIAQRDSRKSVIYKLAPLPDKPTS